MAASLCGTASAQSASEALPQSHSSTEGLTPTRFNIGRFNAALIRPLIKKRWPTACAMLAHRRRRTQRNRSSERGVTF
jgi:hypothetical protein